jgi:glycosyltransferase involved in cell wall biosynthesis
MYAALPIVATRVEAIPEIVDEDVTGFLVPAHDHEALAERLTYLLSNPDVANRMGNAG